jgi:hypothetical protein
MTPLQRKRLMGLSRMSDEVTQAPLSSDWGLNKAKDWKLKLCWIPKDCFLSGKNLWGKRAYHGVRMITGPGEPVFEDYWIDKNEFLIWNLKGR